jgi:hypothetical protein
MTMDPGERIADGTRIAALWAANLLAPVALLASLQVSYMFADRACTTGDMLPVHLTALAGMLLALAGAGIGWREWRRRGGSAAGEGGGPEGRSRFLAVVGLGNSALAALVIAAQWSATLFFHPCQ